MIKRHFFQRGGFTLIELMVVLAMIMILAGAVTSSVSGARERAKITAATVAAREITHAILMYENDAPTHDLSAHVMDSWQDATESNLGFILGGGETTSGGTPIPVLYNASLQNGRILDPWGTPYKVTIREGAMSSQDNAVLNATKTTSVAVPNYWRRRAGEED